MTAAVGPRCLSLRAVEVTAQPVRTPRRWLRRVLLVAVLLGGAWLLSALTGGTAHAASAPPPGATAAPESPHGDEAAPPAQEELPAGDPGAPAPQDRSDQPSAGTTRPQGEVEPPADEVTEDEAPADAPEQDLTDPPPSSEDPAQEPAPAPSDDDRSVPVDDHGAPVGDADDPPVGEADDPPAQDESGGGDPDPDGSSTPTVTVPVTVPVEDAVDTGIMTPDVVAAPAPADADAPAPAEAAALEPVATDCATPSVPADPLGVESANSGCAVTDPVPAVVPVEPTVPALPDLTSTCRSAFQELSPEAQYPLPFSRPRTASPAATAPAGGQERLAPAIESSPAPWPLGPVPGPDLPREPAPFSGGNCSGSWVSGGHGASSAQTLVVRSSRADAPPSAAVGARTADDGGSVAAYSGDTTARPD